MNEKPISEDDLHAYVDGALDEAGQARIEAYLDSHPELAARFRSYAAQRGILRTIFDPIAEEPVPTRLNLTRMIERQSRARMPWWQAVAAAALFLAIGGGVGWFMREMTSPASEGVGALAQEASATFSTYASDSARPVELRDNQLTELAAWATDRMGHKPVIPDLSRSGYRLMGGRVVSTPHGAGLMLMFDNDRGIRLVMLTRPMIVDQNRAMVPQTSGDTTSWSWALNGMGYSIAGALPADDLHPLADDIRRQVRDQA